MIIYVTAKDIEHGSCGSIYSCPVAKAVDRRFPTKVVRVGGGRIIVGIKRYKMPMKVIEFVRDFDNHKPVKPMRFELC